MTAQMTPQTPWEDSVIRIEWSLDSECNFDDNPSSDHHQVLSLFPGQFKVINKVNLPLSDVSVTVTVSENARTWDVSLQNHDQGDENDRTITIGSIDANSESAMENFKWQVSHAGVRYDWGAFPIEVMLTPSYTVSYSPGWGPQTHLTGKPHEIS